RRARARFVDDPGLVVPADDLDEGFAAWMGLRAAAVAERLGADLPLFLRFFRADNATEGKSPASVAWFERAVAR
ncbi:MAG TPA: hypothetical protein VM204_07855, partial [Gaiellaceae bacterium]|nr:hypothetical protein [Gaiellaceae bacterium]